MKPGATTNPVASMRRAAGAFANPPAGATRTIRSPLMATSPANQGLPVPSMMWPLDSTTSKSPPELLLAGGLAARGAHATPTRQTAQSRSLGCMVADIRDPLGVTQGGARAGG